MTATTISDPGVAASLRRYQRVSYGPSLAHWHSGTSVSTATLSPYTSSRSLAAMSRREKARALARSLRLATEDAEAMGFGLPSPVAADRAVKLLERIASHIGEVDAVDVVVGEDGTIEITIVPGREFLTVDIPPTGLRIEMVVQDRTSGLVLGTAQRVTEADVVEWVERAA